MAGRKRSGPVEAENVSIPASSEDDGDASPAKVARSKKGGHPVTLSELRSILLEQTKQLQDSQAASVDQAVKRMEKTMDDKLGVFEGQVAKMDDRVGVLERQIEELLKKGQEPQPLRGLGADDADRRARTLVYGGWPRDTRRGVILDELRTFLSSLGVKDHLDAEPFTTGARRSMALSAFKQRPGESFADMRARMHQVVLAFSTGGQLTKAGGKAWCSYSKTRAERAKGAHAGWIKRVVGHLKPEMISTLDVEWSSGSVWQDSLWGSSDLPVPPGTDMRGVLVRDDLEAKPWVSAKLMAADLKLRERDVRACLEELQR